MKILKTLAILPSVFAFVAVAQAAPKEVTQIMNRDADTLIATITNKDDCRCLHFKIDLSKCDSDRRATVCCKAKVKSSCSCDKGTLKARWKGDNCSETVVFSKDLDLKFVREAHDDKLKGGARPWESNIGDNGDVEICLIDEDHNAKDDRGVSADVVCKLKMEDQVK